MNHHDQSNLDKPAPEVTSRKVGFCRSLGNLMSQDFALKELVMNLIKIILVSTFIIE